MNRWLGAAWGLLLLPVARAIADDGGAAPLPAPMRLDRTADTWTYPCPYVIPAHEACITKQVLPSRCVQRPRFEECKVPVYVQEMRPAYVVVRKPVLVPGVGPLLVPQCVRDVREIHVPVYKEVTVRCGCREWRERVVDHVETRVVDCGTRIVYVAAPGNVRVPQVAVRYDEVKIPIGDRLQWVRKDDRVERRFCGYETAEEAVPGAAPRSVTERAFVPCEAVTVIANPIDPATDEAATEMAPVLPGTRRAITRRALDAILAAIVQGAHLGVDAPPPAPAPPPPMPAGEKNH